ncbi:MAG: hypothetical protein K9M75_05200 [Phycisphaerae bacterium]|nr:hypothetical protein [Phycisphaerae bacterium]
MEDLRIMMLVSMFIVFLFVIYDAAKSADDHDGVAILALLICATVIGMFSMNELLGGNELSYILMGIAIVAVVLFALFIKHWASIKHWLSQHNDKKGKQIKSKKM